MTSTGESAAWRGPVWRAAVGVGVATGAYGLSFGAISVAAGLSVLQTCALSLLMFTGGSQFALVGILGAGGGAVSAAGTAVLLGSRNAFYGLRLASLLDVRGLRRAAAAQLIIDESTAVATAQTTVPAARLGFWATGLSVFVLWNIGTFIGAFGAGALSDPAYVRPRRRRTGRVRRAAGSSDARGRTVGRRPGRRGRRARVGAVRADRRARVARRRSRGRVWAAAPPGERAGTGSRSERRDPVMWWAVLLGFAGCYLLKYVGLAVPKRVLDNARTQRVAALLPVALLTALIVNQTFTTGRHLVLDARAAGLVVACVAVLLRAPFLVVVIVACATTALLRLAV